MRPGRKSRVITWDRHEMRRQLKFFLVFHIQSTFSRLHIGRWSFHYEPNHHGRSSTAGHVFRNVSFCNSMCYIFKCFSCFPFAILRATANFCACQTADAVLRGHKNSVRSENFCDYVSSRSKVDPVWDFRFGLSTETSRPCLSWVFVPVSCNQIKGFVSGPIWTRPGPSSSWSHVITLLLLVPLRHGKADRRMAKDTLALIQDMVVA